MIRTGLPLMPSIFIPALFVLLALVSGCGFKDKPVPPQHVVPKPIADLRVELDDKGATLSWNYPKDTVTGGAVEEIDSFQLYRAEIPQQTYCPTCPVPYDAPIVVPGGILPPGVGRTATYEVRGLRPGNLYFFKVRSKAGWWIESQDSNEISFYWQTPPNTPQAVVANGGDGSNRVQWQPVGQGSESTSGAATIQYQVYRGVDGGPMDKIGEPVVAASYTDTAVENGRVYAYQVKAIGTYPQGAVQSGLSETAEARPLDRTPPPVPSRIEGLRTEVGVKLYWDHVIANDIAGYRIFRRSAGEGKPLQVGEVNLPVNMFVDAKAPNVSLFYSISSIDTQNPANESARSAEIRIDQ